MNTSAPCAENPPEPARPAPFCAIRLDPQELHDGNPAGVLAAKARALGATLIAGKIFGRIEGRAKPPFGVAYLAGQQSGPGKLWGAQGLAVPSEGLAPICDGDRQVGWQFGDGRDRFGYFPALLAPCSPHLPPATQAAKWFQTLDAVLANGGFHFSDVVRTWFFLDRILDWYQAFNRARNAFLEEHRAFGRFVPASTGVGAANSLGSAVCADVLCLQAPEGQPVRSVGSPLQCPAIKYGSSFSRAAEISRPGWSWLTVSGSSSIGPDGQSLHAGDADAQVRLTMDVVAAILSARNLDWRSVWRGAAYLKHPSVEPALDRWLKARGLNALPLTRAVCEICRDELLFEIEVDAGAAHGFGFSTP